MLLVSASFVQAEIESSKQKYKAGEIVSVRNTATLCTDIGKEENVSLYIVENQDEWGVGDELVDVRGEPQEVPNKAFPYTMVWKDSEKGFYDSVIDCDTDKKYSIREPVNAGYLFEVEIVPGDGAVSIGEKNIGNHTWRYDPEEASSENIMMQFKLLAGIEDVTLHNITIQALGNGNDAFIDTLEVYVDENNNGELDEEEIMIGDSQPAYASDNGVSVIVLDYILTKDISESFLIVYQMKENATKGEFSLKINSIEGVGADSEKIISFTGLPLESGKASVLTPKTCLGSLGLELAPESVPVAGENIKAIISGLEECNGFEVALMTTPCDSSAPKKVDSCKVKGEGCEFNLTAQVTRAFYACLDKNEDGDTADTGENVRAILTVGVPGAKLNETAGNENETEIEEGTAEEEGKETTPITGNAIDEIKQKLAETGSFFILLEVTLLLILFVLVMILFRLRPTLRSSEEDLEEEKPKEEGKKKK